MNRDLRNPDYATLLVLGLLAICYIPVLVVGGLLDLAHRAISAGTRPLSKRYPRLPLRKDL